MDIAPPHLILTRNFMKDKKQGKRKFDRLFIGIAIVFFVIGSGVFFYPVVSNYLAQKNQAQVVQSYHDKLSDISPEELEKQWKAAIEYNENLNGDPVHDPFVPGSGYVLPQNYEEVLNVDGVMCYLEIPKISLKLPVYHGTSEEVLEKGIGHLESTSLPIGGESRYSVLTGHRGLPSAELFTRLDELEVGDYFFIHVLDKTLTYQVDHIEVIEPDQLEKLTVVPGQDLVTLLTCTPYGVNSHRLLVRGARAADISPEETEGDSGIRLLSQIERWRPEQAAIVVGVFLVFLVLIVLGLMRNRRKKCEKAKARTKKEK